MSSIFCLKFLLSWREMVDGWRGLETQTQPYIVRLSHLPFSALAASFCCCSIYLRNLFKWSDCCTRNLTSSSRFFSSSSLYFTMISLMASILALYSIILFSCFFFFFSNSAFLSSSSFLPNSACSCFRVANVTEL